jgi:hypothetical protein
MKYILILLAVLNVAVQSLQAQTTTVFVPAGSTQTVQVSAGQVFTLLDIATNGNGVANCFVNGIKVTSVAGPNTVTLGATGSGAMIATYKLSTDIPSAVSNVASQAVVIPSTGIENADIIFESSPDLVTWTAAVAGNYLPGSPNRFFRVRLVTH